VSGRAGCARLLQGGSGGGHGRLRAGDEPSAPARPTYCVEACGGLVDGDRQVRQRVLRLAPSFAVLVGRPAERVLGGLPGVEGVAESEPVVALRGGPVRLRECGPCGAEFGGGVGGGAGRLGGRDGALGLLKFLLWGLGAAGRHEHNREEPERPAAHQASIANQPTLVKHVSPPDRPREKLDRLGAVGLGDNELLALVIGSGARGAGALEVANAILGVTSGLHGLVRVNREELEQVPGVGRARAAQILAAVELGRRTLLRPAEARQVVMTPKDAALLLMPQFGAASVERFGVLLLDTKHRILRTCLLSIGTLDASVVHPRDVFREAVRAGAAAVVLFHNHPSGDPAPSRADVGLTRRMLAAGEMMGIDVADHLILAETSYFSFKEARIL
jgi:DNA repair protein RadC